MFMCGMFVLTKNSEDADLGEIDVTVLTKEMDSFLWLLNVVISCSGTSSIKCVWIHG